MLRDSSLRNPGVFAFLLAFGAVSAGPAAGETPFTPPPPDPEASALIERVEAYHQSLPHFEARFEQRFSPRIFGRDRVETGRMTVKRPGRMRWDYESPELKVFVSDGTNTWFHVPADQQVVVGAFGRSGNQTDEVADAGPRTLNPLDFLTGNAAILDHFDALLAPAEAGAELRTVALIPRRTDGEITSLSLTVNAVNGQIQALDSEDVEGNRTAFRFSDFLFESVPDDSLFIFRIPPGTEVVTASEFRP